MVKNSIKVYARVKSSSDQSQTGKYDIDSKRDYQEITFQPNDPGDCGLYRNSKLKYRFCSIFDQHSRQNDVFDKLARPVVNSVLQGYNGTIFAYGQTGSGKTYSITGSAEYENRGLIPRTIQYIFNYIQKNTNALYNIYISYLEIYNEVCYDLLNPKHRATILEELPRVTLLEDSKGRTHLKNLSVISVASEREARCLMFLGDTNRTIAETPMNLYSSRSHCIFTIHVAATMATDGRVRRSKLHLVDLAGSERIQKSGISGIQLVDAKQINLSLHYLEQVIIALSDAKRVHVPYRNSVMTTVLRDSLGGNCLTAMLATFSIEPRNYEETISTCKFAQRVALVNTEAFINEEEDPNLEISNLKMEIENLKKELAFYKEQNLFENPLDKDNKTEISSARMKEYESHIFSYLKDPSDEFPVVKDLGTIQIYFKIFKKIFKSCQNFTKEKDPPVSNSKNTKKFEEIIKRKNNEICILAYIQLLNIFKCFPEYILAILINLLDREKSISNSKCMPHANIVQNNIPNMQNGLTDQEEFEMFINDSANKSETNYYNNALQQKYKIAESIASRIKMCKQNIVNIKKRMQHPDLTTKLVDQLKIQQNIYRENVIEMQKLKNETDHLKHGLQQANIRIQQRFHESHTSSRVNFDIFDNVFEGSAGSVNNNIAQISNAIEPALNFNEATSSFSNNQLELQPDLSLKQNSNAIVEHRSRFTETYPQDNYLQPINECISNPNLTYQNNQRSFEEVPQKMCGPKIDERSVFDQNNTNLIYPKRQQRYSEKFTKNDGLPVVNKCTTNFHQQIPDSLTRRGNQDYLSPQIENYQQKIPFDARPVYGGYMVNQDANIPLSEVTQQTSNVPCPNQEMDNRGNLRCHYNISQSIPRNNRYPSGPSQASTTEQPGYTDCTVPERLNTIHYDTACRSENKSVVNYESKNVYASHCNTKSNSKQENLIQPCAKDNRNINSQEKNCPVKINENEEEFLKDIPLTGDPEVDEEIIAFYRARQKVFKSNNG